MNDTQRPMEVPTNILFKRLGEYMLQVTHSKNIGETDTYYSDRRNLDLEDSSGSDLSRLINAARRQFWYIAACVGISVLLGLIYISLARPLYSATTTMLVQEDQVQAVRDITEDDEPATEASKIDSHIELLKSRKIISIAVKTLGLLGDGSSKKPNFVMVSPPSGLDSLIIHWKSFWATIFGSEFVAEEQINYTLDAVVNKIQDNLFVGRTGDSYILNVSYRGYEPETASLVSKAVVDAFLLERQTSRYDQIGLASDWLEKRSNDLKEQALQAEIEVQKYRSEYQLVRTNGVLVSDQELSQLNNQLSDARARKQETEARLERIKSIVDNKQLDAAVPEALNNTVISNFRRLLLDTVKRNSELTKNLGADHAQAKKLKAEIAEYQAVIFDELSRIAQSYESEYQIAALQVRALETRYGQLISQTDDAERASVTLDDLQRKATSYRNLYENFLQRYQESLQERSFVLKDARVIDRAPVPKRPSAPNKPIVMVLFIALGGLAGVGLACMREIFDSSLRSTSDIEKYLGVECLGFVPKIEIQSDEDKNTSPTPIIKPGQFRAASKDLRYSTDYPLSSFSEALRSMQIDIDLRLEDKKTKVIGLLSTVSGEGKSTISKNLASMLAQNGYKTLLIDCDVRNPKLTRSLAPQATKGLLEVAMKQEKLADVLLLEEGSNLIFAPLVVNNLSEHPLRWLSSETMLNLLRSTPDNPCDYIILDLPPLNPVVDARALVGQLDAIAYVVEWGKTPRRSVMAALHSDKRLYERCIGAIYSKVDDKYLRYYESYYPDTDSHYFAHDRSPKA